MAAIVIAGITYQQCVIQIGAFSPGYNQFSASVGLGQPTFQNYSAYLAGDFGPDDPVMPEVPVGPNPTFPTTPVGPNVTISRECAGPNVSMTRLAIPLSNNN